MKRIMQKIMVIVLIVFISMNALFPNLIYATVQREVYQDLMTELDNLLNTQIGEEIAEKEKNGEYSSLTAGEKKTFLEELTATVKGKIAEFSETIGLYNTWIKLGAVTESYTAADIKSLEDYIRSYKREATSQVENYLKNRLETGLQGAFQPMASLSSGSSSSGTSGNSSGNAGNSERDPLAKLGLGILDGLLGIVLIPFKILLLVPGVILNLVLSSIASIGGTMEIVTLDKIFFNKLNITKINVFETGANETINQFRTSIAGFYTAFRNLAIVISFAILIYIGIRMAISNIAEEKAKYKEMFTNWAVGFGLIFVLQYIIVITIMANDKLVELLNNSSVGNISYMNQLLKQAWWIPFTTSFASIVMYCGLLLMTFIFLVIYIKRMITISFLVVVAPLISVTYSIDKIGNNRSEILNTWIKEFFYNVLIQPFHCIIYVVFIGIGINLLNQTSGPIAGSLDFGAMTFAIILMCSIFLGQKIIREIFGFSNASSLTEKVAIIALATRAVSNVKNIVAIKGSKNDSQAKKVQKRVEQLPNMQDGSATTLEAMATMRRLNEQRRMQEEEERSNPIGTPSTNIQTKRSLSAKVHRNIRGAKRFTKKAVRWYGNTLVTSTVVGKPIQNAIKERKANRKYHMTEADLFLASSEDYRQKFEAGNHRTMKNEELAEEMERLYNIPMEEINNRGLSASELNYRIWIESMKKSFGEDAKEAMKDMIINGSTENKRWER